MRELSKRRKERVEEEHRLDQENRDREEKASLKRAAEEEVARGLKSLKTKMVKKERSIAREERPLAVGAHGLARQDGRDTTPQVGETVEEAFQSLEDAARASILQETDTNPDFSENVNASASPPKRKLDALSSSSLSSTSQPPSPTNGTLLEDSKLLQKSRESSEGSVDPHQPPPTASIAQYQTFGPDPTAFDDPTIYHIRDVTDDMTDEEKAEIFSVKQFPHCDLSHHIPGTIPDKDFSNAKPSNQVNANTFQAYIENYVRPLTEEDMAFLKERGDRVGPFVMPRRGKRHYTEIWAEEDGQFSLDNQRDKEKLSPNEPRGNIEQMTDEIAETDQISNGPMLNRLLSLMRFENRPSTSSDDARPNGTSTSGEASTTNGFPTGDTNGNTEHPNGDASSQLSSTNPLPPATYMPESALPTSWRNTTTANNTPIQQLPPSSLKMDAATMEDRVKHELRYVGFLPSSADNPSNSVEPDYDAHCDDEVAERLRLLQEELRRVGLENGARKACVLERANEEMAHQEYSTIKDDLDSQ
ncbi:MAG: hypothetical protein Q9177_002198, partial [Variospora cf. flavescens]